MGFGGGIQTFGGGLEPLAPAGYGAEFNCTLW